MRSHGWLAVALATGLSACSGAGNGAKTLPPVTADTATASVAAADAATVRDIECHVAPPGGTLPAPNGARTGPGTQRLNVYPATVAVTTCAGRSAVFDAYENFEGDVTAYAEDPGVATVGPDTRLNAVVPTFGGLKNAWFTIVPVAPGVTRVVVIDRKGNRAYVDVTVTPCPTLLPPPPPPPTPSPVPTASTAPCSADRQALGTRRTAVGGSGPSCGPTPTPPPPPGG